jgi:hypothetical protein
MAQWLLQSLRLMFSATSARLDSDTQQKAVAFRWSAELIPSPFAGEASPFATLTTAHVFMTGSRVIDIRVDRPSPGERRPARSATSVAITLPGSRCLASARHAECRSRDADTDRNSQMDGARSPTNLITEANGRDVRFACDGHVSSSRADEWATRTEHNFALENQAEIFVQAMQAGNSPCSHH